MPWGLHGVMKIIKSSMHVVFFLKVFVVPTKIEHTCYHIFGNKWKRCVTSRQFTVRPLHVVMPTSFMAYCYCIIWLPCLSPVKILHQFWLWKFIILVASKTRPSFCVISSHVTNLNRIQWFTLFICYANCRLLMGVYRNLYYIHTYLRSKIIGDTPQS